METRDLALIKQGVKSTLIKAFELEQSITGSNDKALDIVSKILDECALMFNIPLCQSIVKELEDKKELKGAYIVLDRIMTHLKRLRGDADEETDIHKSKRIK